MKPDATPKQAEIPLPSVNQNVLSYYAARRQRLNIVKTTQTPNGQIIDWIPIESQGPIATPPPPAGKVESKHEDVRSTAVEAMFELQVHGLERGHGTGAASAAAAGRKIRRFPTQTEGGRSAADEGFGVSSARSGRLLPCDGGGVCDLLRMLERAEPVGSALRERPRPLDQPVRDSELRQSAAAVA